MADPIDILTLEEGYQAVNIPAEVGHEEELARWITGLSQRIDQLCGPVVTRTVSDTFNGGRPFVAIDGPVASVTTVTESGTAVDPAGYLLDNVGGVAFLRRMAGTVDSRWLAGRRNVAVAYQAGRDNPAPALFKIAASAILRRLWAREAGAWARGVDPFDAEGQARFFKAVDPMIAEFLADEIRVPAVA